MTQLKLLLFWGQIIVCQCMLIITKDILVVDAGQTQELDNTMITEETKNSINFSRPHKKFCLILHYNESNTFLFVDAIKICQLKGKDSETENILFV